MAKCFVNYLILNYMQLYCVDMAGVATGASVGACCDDSFQYNLVTSLGFVLNHSKCASVIQQQ